MINSRELSDLRYDIEGACKIFLAQCKYAGLNVLIVNTLRDNEYQAKLYAQGRTEAGSIITNGKTTTFHGEGLAFDICKNVKGHEYDDTSFFKKCGAIGKSLGFTWGGDWKSFPDMPHFQWDNQKKSTHLNAPTMQIGADYMNLQKSTGFADSTMAYLVNYKYAADLLHKLVNK